MKSALLRSVVFLCLATVSVLSYAQPFTLSTGYSSNNGSSAITFNVKAGANPITVTQLSCSFSASSTYEIWYSTAPITAAPTVSVASGWTMAASGSSFTQQTPPTHSVLPSTLSITIPAGATYGFCINSGGSLQYLTGTVTPTQLTDGRITIINDPGVGFGGVMNTGWIANRQFCGSVTYVLATPAGPGIPPIASFAYNAGIDTVWLNSPHTFVNTSTNALKSYWDVTAFSSTSATSGFTTFSNNRDCYSWGCFIDSSYNFRFKFTQRGWYKVKIRSENASGMDVLEKVVYVDNPSRKPVANFFTDRRVLGFYDPSFFYDLSLYGPTQWEWYLNPAYIGQSGFGPNTFSKKDGSSIIGFSEQNPMFNPADGGLFDVCLRVSNARGSDTLCRRNYIRVANSFSMCTGGSDSVSFLTEGYLFDQGGPINPYTPVLTDNCPAGFRIAPCADTVILVIERFKLRNQDSITIRNGGGPNAPILKRLGGGNIPDSLKRWVGTTGQLFIQMNVPPTGVGDSGFVFYWTSTPATYGPPKASFSAPDTIYSSYKVTYNNSSTGSKVGYMWDTDGNGVFLYDSVAKDPTAVFSTTVPVTKNICLIAYNCIGQDTVCRNIVIMPVPSRPKAEFTVNRRTGFTTDTFAFIDQSKFGANQWKWTFTPANIGYLNGTSDVSQNPVVFLNSATSYTIRLIATNSLGSDTLVKTAYVTAIAYNSPYTQNPIPSGLDIGITRVRLAEIDTVTPLATPVYHALYNNQKATLYRGVQYVLQVFRSSNNEAQSMKAWIDYNRNTQFGDASNEVLINEVSQRKIVTTTPVRIPDNAPVGNSRLRIGVTYDNTALTPDYAGIGVFEDYGIIVGDDKVRPVIVLNGTSVMNTELNKKFTDPGASAIDNLEGVITSKIQVTGTVDTTRVGMYPLVYTVTDLYGNVSQPVTRLVQVVINQTGPKLTMLGSNPMIIQVKGSYTDPGATAVDNTGSDITRLITVAGSVNVNALGTYPIVYKVIDAFGFVATATRNVQVVDTEAPTWTIPTLIRHQVGTPFVFPNPATDNYWPVNAINVNYTGSLNVNVAGNYTLVFTAVDGSGNQAAPRTVTIQVGDLVPPVIKLNGSNMITHNVHATFNDPGVTASDNYYPNVVISKVSNLDIHSLGAYTITYTATDGAGNSASVSRTVTVVDVQAPVITLLGTDPYNHTRYKAYVDPGYLVSDNYYSQSQITVTVDASQVIHHRPGVYFVYYHATDPSGNKSTVTRTVGVSATGAVGIAENANASGLLVYPNPTKGLLNIAVSGKGVEKIKVFNLLGSLVYEQSVSGRDQVAQIDLGSLKEGVYMVRIESGSQIMTRKINIVR